jgi:hypothetical protein
MTLPLAKGTTLTTGMTLLTGSEPATDKILQQGVSVAESVQPPISRIAASYRRDFAEQGESRLPPRPSHLDTGTRSEVARAGAAEGNVNKHRERPGVKRRMKPEFAFDICHDIYKGAREVLESKRGLYAFDMEAADKYLWRPDIRPRLNEYVADFALAGAAALDTPKLASRLVMFRVYHLGGANYHRARAFLGLSEYAWSQWVDQIRRVAGKELVRRGMVPPRRYFQEPTR